MQSDSTLRMNPDITFDHDLVEMFEVRLPQQVEVITDIECGGGFWEIR